jgi:hypothetical protein
LILIVFLVLGSAIAIAIAIGLYWLPARLLPRLRILDSLSTRSILYLVVWGPIAVVTSLTLVGYTALYLLPQPTVGADPNPGACDASCK